MAAGAAVAGVMAGSGGAELGPAGDSGLMASLTPEEKREIEQYSELLRFRDQVVGGLHPRIKPTHLPGKSAQNARNAQNAQNAQSQKKPPTAAPAATSPQAAAAKTATANGSRPVIDKPQAYQAKQLHTQAKMAPSLPGLGTLSGAPAGASSRGTGKPEINPVLLEKSDDLIKAEIQLQRQRVERSLKEQLEQRRAANKASDKLAELDVADIMAKAMSLVHATPAAQSTDDTAANVSASSDSNDDNTFYSSRHDTPEFHMAARLPNESEDDEMREGSPYEPELDLEPVAPRQPNQPVELPAQAIPGVAPPQPQKRQSAPAPVQASPAAMVTVPGLSIGASSATRVHQPQSAGFAGLGQSNEGSRRDQPGPAGDGVRSGAHELPRASERLSGQFAAREPAVVRAHNLSPFAPQPTHVAPPAIASQPQLNADEPNNGPQIAPAQVAALRKQGSNGSSPDSSPQGSKAAEKKKNKKKKRKADRLAAETAAASPYIKPEPRSPSPLTPQYARPSKRQRHSLQQPLEIQDDEPRYEQRVPVDDGYQERYQPRVVRQERVVGYERADPYGHHRGEEPILITSPRYERVYYDDHRGPPPNSYSAVPELASYAPREIRTVRSAARLVDAPYEEDASYYHDVRTASRMSVRPAAYPLDRSQSPIGYERQPAAMLPPRAPRRIIVDAFGREYLEPVRPATVSREDLTAAEARGPYERALPPRALSRRPDALGDEALLYRPASPVYAAPRRVVTQPEYSHREDGRANTTMPPPPSEYLPSRAEPAGQYLARAASVRPPLEPSRYDAPPPSYERIPAAALDDRPPAPLRDYYRAASARPADGGVSRYDIPGVASYEQREHAILPASARDYPPPLRPASVHPATTTTAAAAEPPQHRYELPREYAPRRPQPQDYDPPAGPYQDARGAPVMTMPPPPPQQQHRAYSALPGEEPVLSARRAEYALPPRTPAAEAYYGRPRLPPTYRRAEDEEVVFLERPPSHVAGGGYREMR